ncbi:hypothetical protein C7974DRAFT_433828 [Boeremia exigua]|uniref:uncharacterized protein n=1 Tax=Boeremia exigua TaxID=749465 RepID=UPI001E8D8A36|nr:uncharacterized protein C7974DRAFT_433828 [Boeremia exigua]KAH6629137.1 hypothetical protein C7974DRAFT_433828 [Boeremia exigua]
MPLHLLFNSVVFTNLQANEYFVNPVTEDWLAGGSFDTSRFVEVSDAKTDEIVANINAKELNVTFVGETFINTNNAKATYQKLDTAACFDKFNNQYMSDAGNVYLVHSDPIVWRNHTVWWPLFHLNNSFTWTRDSKPESPITEIDRNTTLDATIPFLSTPDFYLSNGWRCPSHTLKMCDVDNEHEVPGDRSKWQPFEAPIAYCMVEEVQESCRLQFSLIIAALVVVSNFVKAVCMALTLLMYRRHLPLVTVGDTIAHFLDCPDPETKGRCLFSRHLMEAQWTWEFTHGAKKDELGVPPERFDPKRRAWQTAPSGYRWLATYILFVAAIIFAIVCMARTVSAMPKDVAKLWKIGFGTITGNNLLNISTTLVGGILLANLPQAVLSYLYLAFNALYTNMFVAQEWSTYMENRKPLRVTSPIGQQRDTYWLNVPFRYAIPMTVMSGLFHWLASQSIFLVQITVLNAYTREAYKKISTCGFSPVAIILCTVLGTIIAIGGFALGRFRYAPGMPVAGSCSAAISAACHPLPEDTDAAVLPVQWGAVTHGEKGVDGKPPVGHCTFSSFPVHTPKRGQLYA